VQSLLQWTSNKYYIFRVCVCVCVRACVPLVIQHAKHIRRIILSSATCTATYFSKFLINGTIFGKTLLNITCVFRLSPQILSHISHSKRNSARLSS